MSKTVMMCYEKIEEIFNDLDRFESKAKNNPSGFQRDLKRFQGQCNSRRNTGSGKSNGEETRKARDLSAKLIMEYGIYGALEKVADIKELLETCPGLYLSVALGVIEIEIEEVLETSLRMKFPKLLKLSQSGQTQAMTDLINREDNIEYLLGIIPPEEPLEQTTLFEIEEPKKKSFRYDQYLRIKRKMGAEDFMYDMIHKAMGIDEFSASAGTMIVTITESPEMCSSMHPCIPRKLMKIISLAMGKSEDDFEEVLNPNQISLDDLPKVYSYTKN